MFVVQRIESFAQPELQPYATMRRPTAHREQGIFVAEGTKVVERLLESTLGVISVVLPEELLPAYQGLLEKRPEHVTVYLAPKPMLEQLTGFAMFQGVLALARVPAPLSLDEALTRAPRPGLLVAAEGLTNAENVGVLVRNCAAFGVGLLVVGETCASPYLRRAVRNSMGTIFQQNLVETHDLGQTLQSLRGLGIRCLAAHPHTDQSRLADTDLTGDCCLVFGSEGEGLTPRCLELCHEAVAIPMASGVDSLNVSNAVAVFLYEAARQRGLMG